MRSFCLVLLGGLVCVAPALANDPNPPSIHSDRGAWPLYRQWNEAEFAHYSKWIANIYDKKAHGTDIQRAAKLERVLTDPEMNWLLDPAFLGSPSNPDIDPVSIKPMHNVLDCGKLTIALTGYYSLRRGLPWMISVIRSGDGKDIRQSGYNVPVGEISSFDYDSAHQFFVDSVLTFCTGNYRVAPNGTRAENSDTVPIAITPKFMVPGTLYYLDGHVMILAAIGDYGEVHFLDSTTAASRDIYTHNSMNAVTGLTGSNNAASDPLYGCFRGFRVHRFPIAVTDADGKVLRVRRSTDAEMAAFGFSLEQYEKIEEFNKKGEITEGEYALSDLHELVRFRLRTKTQVDPYLLIETYADELIAMFQQREEVVQAAWKDVQANGPIPFPERSEKENIFNASGRWGQWSTAQLDADSRSKYFNLQEWIDSTIRWFDRDVDSVILSRWDQRGLWGRSDLALAITFEKDKIFRAKTFQYNNSAGEPVTLTLADIEERLFDLSFDPNHPPELRWGARPGSAEAANAPEMPTPLGEEEVVPMREAYARQAYYRSLTRRETEPSFLRDMFESGFPTRKTFNAHIALWYNRDPSPPLVPHNTRAHDRVNAGL